MVYYFCHCMSLHVCLVKFFILDSRLSIFFFERNSPFWLSAFCVLVVVPLF